MISQGAISTKKDYLLDEQVDYLLRLACQRHSGIFQSRTINGLTATQFSAMLRLYQ